MASGKKKVGRLAGLDPSRRGFYRGEWEPWEFQSRGPTRPDLHLWMAFRASHPMCRTPPTGTQEGAAGPRRGPRSVLGYLQRSEGWTPESSGGEGQAQAIGRIK